MCFRWIFAFPSVYESKLQTVQPQIYIYIWNLVHFLWTLTVLNRRKFSDKLTCDSEFYSSPIYTANGSSKISISKLNLISMIPIGITPYNNQINARKPRNWSCLKDQECSQPSGYHVVGMEIFFILFAHPQKLRKIWHQIFDCSIFRWQPYRPQIPLMWSYATFALNHLP